MLHFLTGVYNSLFSTTEYNVLIVGRECAGKSTLLEQLKFLYTPAGQQQTSSVECSSSNGSAQKATATADAPTNTCTRPPQQQCKQSRPPGTPLPATAAQMTQKRIRPTVGLNYAVVQHRFSPPASAVTRVKKSQLPLRTVAALPSPPQDLLAEQRARQQAVMANAPSDVLTRVVLRDLGGQAALRSLWERYFPRTQGLVYVIDSTLPFRIARASSSQPSIATPSPRDHFTRQELEEVYKQDRELLARLLQHPLLHGVPVLLLSNKTDEVSHISLTTLQEVLQLAELAVNPAFYILQNSGDSDRASGALKIPERQHNSSSHDSSPSLLMSSTVASPNGTPLSRYGTCSEEVQLRVGGSGFGEIAMRVVEVSALDGVGVAGAMDWLVAQLLHRARDVDNDA